MPSATTEFTINGAEELEAKLRMLGPAIANKIGDKGLRAGIKVIVKDAKRRAPRGPTKGPHKLYRSITAIVNNKGAGEFNRRVTLGFRPPTSRRAHISEFGTVTQSGTPFVRPALASQMQAALDAMAITMTRAIAAEEFKSFSGGILSLGFDGAEIDVGD
jgi:HK97 gp10 family phage protein